MDNGIGSATQVVSVAINGTESFFRLTGSFAHFTLHELKCLLCFVLARRAEQNKMIVPGETKIDKLFELCRKNGSEVSLINLSEDIKSEFEEYCSSNKLTYSYLFDVNKNDNKIVAAYSSSQMAAFEVFMREHYGQAEPYSFNEYKQDAVANPESVVEAQKMLNEDEFNIFKKMTNDIEQKERTNKPVSFIILKSQVSGYTDKEIEIAISDGKSGIRYTDVPKDCLKKINDKSYMVTLTNNDVLPTFENKGIFNEDNKYIDMRYDRATKEQPLYYQADGIGILAKMRKDRIIAENKQSKSVTFSDGIISKTFVDKDKNIKTPKVKVSSKTRR